jgi:hypothetical protein
MNDHEQFLREFAEKAKGTYEGLLAALADFAMNSSGDDFAYNQMIVRGQRSEEVTTEDKAFWKHYEALTGVSPWNKECRGC